MDCFLRHHHITKLVSHYDFVISAEVLTIMQQVADISLCFNQWERCFNTNTKIHINMVYLKELSFSLHYLDINKNSPPNPQHLAIGISDEES